MNILFTLLFLTASFLLLVKNPEGFLEAMLTGGSKAAATSFALIATYAVWLGLIRVWEDSGVARGVARLVRPLTKRLLKTEDEATLQAASMNFSVNLLGISGAATPYGITTAKLLDKSDQAEYASTLFFVLNATSLQLFPASMIAVRVATGSVSPTDILLPTLFTTAFSTLLSVALARVLVPPKKLSAPQFSYTTTAQGKSGAGRANDIRGRSGAGRANGIRGRNGAERANDIRGRSDAGRANGIRGRSGAERANGAQGATR